MSNKEAEKFREYINHPVLTQIKKQFSGFEVYDVEPLTIPDVMAERPVVIYGKYRGKPQGTITLKGHTGSGKFTKTFDVANFKPDEKNAAIRYLWARKKIQQLDDYNNLGYSNETVQLVTQLGLKYDLMTAYTSFLAVDEEIVNGGKKITTVKQPLPMPQGVSDYAVGFDLEVDEIDFVMSLFKAVTIIASFDDAKKQAVKNEIEEKVNNELMSGNNLYNLEGVKVKVTVDAFGNVLDVELKGQIVSKEGERRIKEFISKWNFKKHLLNMEWTFEIEF
ncbi:MAG: hypothetical protein HC906_03695 [Bacteroidales bacterium]|nr:hypothetical protein [Bacteroidales bacterium]